MKNLIMSSNLMLTPNNLKWEENQIIIDANKSSSTQTYSPIGSTSSSTTPSFSSAPSSSAKSSATLWEPTSDLYLFTADLYLFTCEFDFIYRLIRYRQYDLMEKFRFTLRYLDNILSINNQDFLNLRSLSADNRPFISFLITAP
eukprot:g17539.t1